MATLGCHNARNSFGENDLYELTPPYGGGFYGGDVFLVFPRIIRSPLGNNNRQVRLLTRQVDALEVLRRGQAAIPPTTTPMVEKARFSPG